jgi:2'-5' RNA ligase
VSGGAGPDVGGAGPDVGGAGPEVFGDPDLLTGRLFFAVGVPGPVKAPFEDVRRTLAGALPGARLPEPSGWHLTLAFLGRIRAEFSAEVVAIGEAAAAVASRPTLHLEGAGGFPDARRARVLWTGVAGDVDALGAVAAALAAGCRDAGLPAEQRPFVPHLTIARLPSPRPLPEELLDEVAAAAAQAPAWTPRTLACYRSTVTHQGARYQVVREFPFAR